MPELSIPKKSVAPPEKDKDSVTEVPNWADKEETVSKFLALARAYYQHFKSQSARAVMVDNMKLADQMFRMSADQTKQDENMSRSDVDTIPDIYHRILRTVSANESDIILHGEGAPVRVEPLETIDPEMLDAVKEITDQHNTLLEYTMDEDDRRKKIRHIVWLLQKYANCLLEMGWYQQDRTIRERMPKTDDKGEIVRDKDGKASLVWRKTKKTKIHPMLTWHDLADSWFDSTLDDMQAQQCILTAFYPVLDDLRIEQRDGHYKNVGMATADHLLASEPGSEGIRADRQSNAGEGDDINVESGVFVGFRIWMRAPINDDGEWSPEDTYSRWCWADFIGDIEKDNPVCVRLNPNPYNNGENPFYLAHSHDDDKGAYHTGWVNILGPIYREYKTTLDQWFDNKNLILAAPMITERGAIVTRDKSFGPRRLIEMMQGRMDKLKRLEIPSVTGDMQAFIGYLEQTANEAAATTKPFRGVPAGGRTSASEARNIFDQSMKPNMEKLRYQSEFLTWMARWDIDLWKQFAPVDLTITLTRKNLQREVKPAWLWGEVRYRTYIIDEYERDALARQEQDRFLQTTLPVLAPIMGKRGLINTGRFIYRQRDFPVDEMFPVPSETDSRHVAQSENRAISGLMDDGSIVEGAFDEPQPGEDHDVHISEHASFESVFSLLPDVQQNPAAQANLKNLQIHKRRHVQLRDQEQQGVANASQQAQEGNRDVMGMGTGETPPTSVGELQQDVLGAEGGAMA